MNLPENIAYSIEYVARRQQEMSIFEEYDSIEERKYPLSNGDITVFKHYVKEVNGQQILCASKFRLLRNEEIIYSYDMPIDNGHLIIEDLIEHENGNQYLLFTTELYGYSILNLSTLKDFHYIPKGRLEEEESFIWLEAQYCPKTKLLWVLGCYWACPGSALIVDFSSPEKMPFPEYDLMDMIQFTGAFEPVEWTKEGDLLYKMGKEEKKLSCEKLVGFFENV